MCALNSADKEFIKLTIRPLEIKIENVETLVTKQNGRVVSLEKTAQERALLVQELEDWHETGREATCPHKEEIEESTKCIRDGRITKKFVVKSISIAGVVVGLLYGAFKLIEHLL